jgi:hypothetical protein
MPVPPSAKADLVYEIKALEKSFKHKAYAHMKKHELELRLGALKRAMGIIGAVETPTAAAPAISAPLGPRQIPIKEVIAGDAAISVPLAPPPRTNTATPGPVRRANRAAAYEKVAKEVAASPAGSLFSKPEAPKKRADPGTGIPYERKLPKEGEPLTFGQKMAIARANKKAAREAAAGVTPPPAQIAPTAPVLSGQEPTPAPARRAKPKVRVGDVLSLEIGEAAEPEDPISRICRKVG